MGSTFLKGTAVAAALALGAGAASATTINPQNTSGTINAIFDGGGFEHVRVREGTTERRVRAGGFRVEEESVGDFIAWCAKLAATLSLPSDYTKRTLEAAISDTQIVNRIHALFNFALPTLDVSNSAAGKADSAAFQMALWNILYDDNFTVDDIAGSGFAYVGGSGVAEDAKARANEFLAAVQQNENSDTRYYTLTFWEAATDKYGQPLSQDLISAAPIPLPAAAWMLIAALGAAAAVSRRRRDA